MCEKGTNNPLKILISEISISVSLQSDCSIREH